MAMNYSIQCPHLADQHVPYPVDHDAPVQTLQPGLPSPLQQGTEKGRMEVQ